MTVKKTERTEDARKAESPKSPEQTTKFPSNPGVDLLMGSARSNAGKLWQVVEKIATPVYTNDRDARQAVEAWIGHVDRCLEEASNLMLEIYRSLPKAALIALKDEEWVQYCMGLEKQNNTIVPNSPLPHHVPPPVNDAKADLLNGQPLDPNPRIHDAGRDPKDMFE